MSAQKDIIKKDQISHDQNNDPQDRVMHPNDPIKSPQEFDWGNKWLKDGMMYFVEGNSVGSEFGFPRVDIKKKYRWKKMNFTTDLPKKNPFVTYIVASAVKCEKQQKNNPNLVNEGPPFRMHAVILNEKNSSGEQINKIYSKDQKQYILCHIRETHKSSKQLQQQNLKLEQQQQQMIQNQNLNQSQSQNLESQILSHKTSLQSTPNLTKTLQNSLKETPTSLQNNPFLFNQKGFAFLKQVQQQEVQQQQQQNQQQQQLLQQQQNMDIFNLQMQEAQKQQVRQMFQNMQFSSQSKKKQHDRELDLIQEQQFDSQKKKKIKIESPNPTFIQPSFYQQRSNDDQEISQQSKDLDQNQSNHMILEEKNFLNKNEQVSGNLLIRSNSTTSNLNQQSYFSPVIKNNLLQQQQEKQLQSNFSSMNKSNQKNYQDMFLNYEQFCRGNQFQYQFQDFFSQMHNMETEKKPKQRANNQFFQQKNSSEEEQLKLLQGYQNLVTPKKTENRKQILDQFLQQTVKAQSVSHKQSEHSENLEESIQSQLPEEQKDVQNQGQISSNPLPNIINLNLQENQSQFQENNKSNINENKQLINRFLNQKTQQQKQVQNIHAQNLNYINLFSDLVSAQHISSQNKNAQQLQSQNKNSNIFQFKSNLY
ncbi:hypothetical protein PPERSA_01522 [Pseudocohnilembus persalinus]|uniref:Uncharacterized protein n=1 Tax=Pseudocohnilembus persalinus TaxID=266149 RepID=A0A0V0R7M6_PSEPJ|nr:hypothetical protein PPERSA_01522 [Pseudocohnilembus persalinus]|eukprot:KRX10510.1 hypothetical protein PPERSA_01522 [Pseudocohnilembus persalinus]